MKRLQCWLNAGHAQKYSRAKAHERCCRSPRPPLVASSAPPAALEPPPGHRVAPPLSARAFLPSLASEMADLHEETSPAGEQEEKAAKNSSSDDDSSSSSSGSGSGSSSSSSSSDSESEDEAAAPKEGSSAVSAAAKPGPTPGGFSGGGYGASSSGPALSAPRAHGIAANTEQLNVNSTRAVARFRAAEQNSSQGLMALGTRKRDRRTIEEIQRDLRDKRKKPLHPVGGTGPAAARASPPPPRGSPVRSPEAEAVVNSGAPLVAGAPLGQFGANGRLLPSKRKPVSAHDRLAKKLNGRRTTGAAAAKPKKSSAAVGTAGTYVPPVSVMTSTATKTPTRPMTASGAVATGNSSSSDHGGETGGDGFSSSGSKTSLPAVDGKVVRALLRAMLRYGDLTDVGLCPSAANFADEYKMPSFVERANLQTSTRLTSERLLQLAADVAQRAKQAVEMRPPQDSIKVAEVEIRSSQVIERLYENLKLRVAVQRALRTAGCSSGGAQASAQGAYVLVAKQSDLAVLGVHARDLPNWTWAEKEHDWSPRKDAALLLGVYVHGFGGWEDILNDDLLHFQSQRALKGERLKKRAENLLKRVPPPDVDAGDPRVVQLASALGASAANSNQSLGAQFSAIIHSGAIPGVAAASSTAVSAGAGASGGGRLQRAAERLAARQQSGEDPSTLRRQVGLSNGVATNGQALDAGRPRKSSPLSAPQPEEGEDNGPEDGEVGPATSPSQSTSSRAQDTGSSRHKRQSTSLEDEDRSSTRKKHRSSSGSSSKKDKRKKEHRRSSRHGDRKTESEPPAAASTSPADATPTPLLTTDECYDKWKPSKKLREIRQVLKKMKIMAAWSRNQKDETVVEKVFKYVSTIGEAIDRIVARQDDKASGSRHRSSDGADERANGADDASSREADELCTCLWTYAAGFTPFTPQRFERLYDDICADGDALVATRS
ncbi:hypothetical protein BBJ28_00009504 [Nothophytophthora sp. Chile5]|nr:hypothetical protein BBJ28_00009504 [Nothophytophthora sp. Chile5]